MKNHLDFTTFLKKSLQKPEIKAEYDKLQPEFTLIEAVIQARKERHLTQKDLAKKIGTKQSVISRLESGRGNPTFSFLKKIAHALGSHLEIRFRTS